MPRYAILYLGVLLLLSVETASGQVVINEIQASNRVTIADIDGDSSDWIELYNASDAPYDIGGHGLSDDSTNLLKWVFPPYLMRPGEHLLVWCSGKDQQFPSEEQILRTNSPVEVRPTILDLEQEWSYLGGLPESDGPPAGWNQAAFDDAAWSRGRPGFGFGDGDDRTELERGIGALFLRTTFNVENLESLENIILQVNYDDGFVAWLNGTRVISVNFPEDAEPVFNSNSTRSREARRVERWMIPHWLELLQPEGNLLAVALLNRTHTSNDMSFLPEIGIVGPAFHANFELDSDGEILVFSNPAGEILDGLDMPEQTLDRSYGRVPDGSGEFSYLLYPTPGDLNDEHASSRVLPYEISFTPPGGFHSAGVNVTLSADIPFDDFQIRYTTNGTAPTATSTLYAEPLSLPRDRVIRAAGFLGDRMVLRPVSQSYFIARRNLVLPVLSVSMNPADFQQVHNNSGGRGRAAERASFLEIFETDGRQALKTGFGMRLHGGAGRGGDFNIKKAYKAYFRGEYGDKKLRYPIIPDTDVEVFDKLVLRSNFNDAFRTGGGAAYIRDQVIRDLHEDMGALVSNGSWYNLFVNMQYRGVYNIVERMDKVFFASYFPEDGENWDVIKTGNDPLDGDTREWTSMLNFFRNTNMREAGNLELAAGRIDIENYTSYMILNIWAQNHDWPHNNWYAARPRREDGRWIFLSWDAEFGLGRNPGGWSVDTFNHVLGRSSGLSTIMVSLIASPDYAQYFIDELDRHLEGPLSAQNVITEIRRHKNAIEGDMIEECQMSGQSIGTWNANIRTLEVFAQRRGPAIRNAILSSARLPMPRARYTRPDSIELVDPVEIRIFGSRLTEDTTVTFNDIPSPRVERISSRELLAVVPADSSLEGEPTITLDDPALGHYTARGLLEVSLVRPTTRALQPDFGSEAGGDTILVLGENFTEDVRVEFDGVPAPVVEAVGDAGETLSVVTPPGRGFITVRVINTRPDDLPSAEELTFTYIPSDSPSFLRGDCDGDGRHSISDGICVLSYLFRAGEIGCPDSVDADDSGSLGITDAVYLLNWLFRLDPAPAAPFPDCGSDPTEDKLDCPGEGSCG